ncbi:uncharacterized protein LOC108913875 [Anoplophora glabripennis]|uniref:uncharacterized protein LOC108913875 n=1 Tax=Anoplophora glabripennis TaxID=217634 RepID=UPI0008746D20|nr:uncharacterized protein LOC108913875 [Anoplophora glabripennis]
MALSAAVVMSGLPREQFTEDIQCVFNYGEILLKSPSPSSLSTSSFQSSESGISSMSSESLLQSLDRYLDIISNLEYKFQVFQDIKKLPTFKTENKCIKVIYQNRNILDLDQNLKSNWLFQHAILQRGIANFFENRSQYSRVNGATIPRHFMIRCKENDCGFNEPKYY